MKAQNRQLRRLYWAVPVRAAVPVRVNYAVPVLTNDKLIMNLIRSVEFFSYEVLRCPCYAVPVLALACASVV